MGRPTGRPPKPTEVKRRLGNPGKRPLPTEGTLVVLPPPSGPPEPARPLGQMGRELWDRIWTSGATWLAMHVDAETVLVLCEQMDERQQLRVSVMREGSWRDRAGLRALDAQVITALSLLGFNPVERSRLGVAEVKRATALDQLRERRSASGKGE